MSGTRKNTVIVGDGEIGLGTAILLAQRGVIPTVVGPWAHKGYYTRTGDQVDVVPIMFSKYLKLKINQSTIKDIERQLYAYAKTLGVQFIGGTFKTLRSDKKEMEILDTETKKIRRIVCDHVIECSGADRAVINDINRQMQPQTKEDKDQSNLPPFKIEVIPDNPRTKMLSLRTTDSTWRYGALTEGDQPLTKDEIVTFRKLGWPYYTYPECYSGAGIKRRMIYMEAPEGLDTTAKQLEWRNTVLAGRGCGVVLCDTSRKWSDPDKPTKPNMSYFSTSSRKVTPAYFAGGEVLVVHLGDSTINLSFETGRSASLGIERAVAYVDSCTMMNGEIIKIDLDGYSDKVIGLVKKAEEAAEFLHYQRLRRNRQIGYDYWVKEVLTYYQTAIDSMQQLSDPEKGFNLQSAHANTTIEKILNLFKEALSYLPKDDTQSENKQKIFQGLLTFAQKCTQLGTSLYESNPDLAVEYYKRALFVYLQYSPNSNQDEKLALYINLTLILADKKPDEALKYADFVLKDMDRVTDVNKKNRYQKQIIFKKIEILLTQVDLERAKDGNTKKINGVLDKAELLIKQFRGIHYLSSIRLFDTSANIEPFEQRIVQLRRKFSGAEEKLEPMHSKGMKKAV